MFALKVPALRLRAKRRVWGNEIYIGTRIYNKTWRRLKQKRRSNPRAEWVIRKEAFDPVVSWERFERAQKRLWSMFAKKRDAEWAVKKAKVMILQAARTFLSEQGIDEDVIFELCNNFPLVLSTSKSPNDATKEWYFVLPETLRTHEHIIGVGIVTDQVNPVDQWFIIPTKSFGVGGVCAFAEGDKPYASYAVSTEQLTQLILALAKKYQIRYTEELSLPTQPAAESASVKQ